MANVRNLVDALVEPADGMNVLEGANGQGKTNFLEGLYLLSGLRSFRGARFADVRGSGDSTFEIEARIATARGERHVRQCWSRQGRRAWIDDRLARGSSELLEQLPMVFFGPDDLQLVKGGPALRRAFLDEACVQIHPESSADLRRYTQVLRERNRLLRDAASGDHDATMLRVYTRTLAEAGQAVLGHRRRLMESLAPELEGTLDRMSGGLHKGSVALAPSSFISAGAPS